MPNWCANSVTISGQKAVINELAEKIQSSSKGVCSAIIPEPADLVDNDDNQVVPKWYQWRIHNWGTKWDFDPVDEIEVVDHEDGSASLSFIFDSAWQPPTALYSYLIEDYTEEQDLSVVAHYFEPGMGIVGVYEDGINDEWVFSDYTSKNVRRHVPAEVVDKWCLVDLLEEMEEELED